jgi:hypothetical protein
MTTQKIDEDWG